MLGRSFYRRNRSDCVSEWHIRLPLLKNVSESTNAIWHFGLCTLYICSIIITRQSIRLARSLRSVRNRIDLLLDFHLIFVLFTAEFSLSISRDPLTRIKIWTFHNSRALRFENKFFLRTK